jgi:predicted PurR-regulated permease PerM
LIAIVPPVAAALQESATKAVIVLGFLMAYQQFEDRFLVPTFYGRTLNLPPLIVLIAVLAGVELLGVVGALLALPLTAAARVAVDFTIANRRLPLVSALTEDEPATDAAFAPDMPEARAAMGPLRVVRGLRLYSARTRRSKKEEPLP